jgi:hypothetical protein
MPTYEFPVNLTFPGSGSPGVNIWHCRTTGDFPSTGELQGLSEIIEDFYTAIKGYFPGAAYTASYLGVASTVEEDPQFDTSAPAWVVVGSGGVNVMPQATAICMTLRTLSADRSGRGRKFLGPFSVDAMQSDGSPTTAALTAIRAAGLAMVVASTAFANGAIGVYSQQESVIRDITGATVRDQFAVLRSRRD